MTTINQSKQLVGLNRRQLIAAAALAPVFPIPAIAQAWPSKNIRMIVPFTPGGSTDIVGRLFATSFAEMLPATVIVENRPGAGGMIGVDTVAKSPPDGYTLGISGVGTTILAHLMGPLPNYKPEDLAIVGNVCSTELIMLARADFPANNATELAAVAKASPGKFSYAESGGPTHLSFELFKTITGIDVRRVPYKGAEQVLTDLYGGHIDLTVLTIPGAIAAVQSGKIKAIGVTAPVRSRALPDIPSISETLPGYGFTTTTMMVAAAGTPEPIINRLNGVINDILKKPDVIERYQSLGLAPSPQTPSEAAASVKSDIDKWAKLIKDANIPTER